jgi:hypothetical protein
MVYLKVADKPDPHTRLEKLQFMIFTLEQTIKVHSLDLCYASRAMRNA